MDETRVDWWMDAGSRWHRGVPPYGYWQAEDGRWHAPGDEHPTEEVEEDPSLGPAHLADGRRSTSVVDGWGWPRWARIAVLASVAVLAVVVVAAAAITDVGGDGDRVAMTPESSTTTATPGPSVASSPGPSGPSSNVPSTGGSDATETSAPPTTVRASTSTTAAPPTSAPTTTRPPAADTGVRQGVPCSPEGATAVSDQGVPMTCTTQKCHGAPYDSARWRRSAC